MDKQDISWNKNKYIQLLILCWWAMLDMVCCAGEKQIKMYKWYKCSYKQSS